MLNINPDIVEKTKPIEFKKNKVKHIKRSKLPYKLKTNCIYNTIDSCNNKCLIPMKTIYNDNMEHSKCETCGASPNQIIEQLYSSNFEKFGDFRKNSVINHISHNLTWESFLNWVKLKNTKNLL